jgi:putative nucleotidyltransferase with HDIG domain
LTKIGASACLTGLQDSPGRAYSLLVGELVDQATEIAERALAEALPRRWTHVQAVAAKAATVAPILLPPDREVLIAAAWLHDVGYGPDAASTGLHALDGGRWLLQYGVSPRVAALVAHHSCALFEAEERGLAHVLAAEFQQEQSATADALWYSDMTTGPDGQSFTVRERLAEVRSRYGPEHTVTRFWARAEPALLAAAARTEALLAAQPM